MFILFVFSFNSANVLLLEALVLLQPSCVTMTNTHSIKSLINNINKPNKTHVYVTRK